MKYDANIILRTLGLPYSSMMDFRGPFLSLSPQEKPTFGSSCIGKIYIFHKLSAWQLELYIFMELCTHRLLIGADWRRGCNGGLNLVVAGLSEENLVDAIVSLVRDQPAG